MIRPCYTKADLADAQDRQARLERQRERGLNVEDVEVVLHCKPCNGQLLSEEPLGKERVGGIIFENCADILCPRHALAFLKREYPKATMQDLLHGLQRYETGETGLKAPGLYSHMSNVSAPAGALTTA